MATGFTVEEVRELVLDDSDCDESIQSDEERDEDEEKLGALLDSFDGGEQFNQSFFKENGVRVLMPLVQAAKPCDDSKEQPQRLSAAKLLSITNINAGSLLMAETRSWLVMIDKRLAGKVSIRRPYQVELQRSIPYEIFATLKSIIKNADDAIFEEPSCYVKGNNKAEVISFTSLGSLLKLLSLLSALSTREVKKYLGRKLTSSTRAGNKVKVIVDDSRDFAFVYKKSACHLLVQFYYGEWNVQGFPRHNCKIAELSP